jgi:hypothetical protein
LAKLCHTTKAADPWVLRARMTVEKLLKSGSDAIDIKVCTGISQSGGA